MASNPNANIQYYASNMVLNVHSNVSYLVVRNACSRAGRHFFLGSLPKDRCYIHLDGAILTKFTTLKCITASTVIAELGVLFLSAM